MKILLIGRQGQLARELAPALACLAEVVCIDRNSKPLAVDLSDPDSIRTAVRMIRPDLVVNAAAYTAVDQAEKEQQQANQVNAIAPGILAEMVAEKGGGIVHFSTDYVFNGSAEQPYAEDDDTDPANVYGQTKLAGEIAIQQVAAPHMVFRTSWVYGRYGRNFFLTMARLIADRECVNVVDDQRGAPTWSRLIAETTALAIARGCSAAGRIRDEVSGVYHLSAGGETSWFGFARKIKESGQVKGLFPGHMAEIQPITSLEFPTPAGRPAYSVLDNTKLHSRLGLRLPDWDSALDLFLTGYPDRRE